MPATRQFFARHCAEALFDELIDVLGQSWNCFNDLQMTGQKSFVFPHWWVITGTGSNLSGKAFCQVFPDVWMSLAQFQKLFKGLTAGPSSLEFLKKSII